MKPAKTQQVRTGAHILRLDTQTRGELQRSYVALAYEMERWCGRAGVDTGELKRELWRRMAFNAICGNGDDHPRNLGLLHRDGRWGLADAFDIAPYITFSGTLAMAITRDGSSAATTANLLKTCENFAYDPNEAIGYIEATKATVAAGWGEEQGACGFMPGTLPPPSFAWLAGKS